MEDTIAFLTIKQAAQQVNKSEQTIRRLVKQHAKTSHIRVEQTPKGSTYLISQAFLAQQYPSLSEQLPMLVEPALVPEVAELQRQLAERDQTIQQLQNRLLEQNDVLNALTNQVNSQRIGRIEELILSQNEQLGELQKRLPELGTAPLGLPSPEPTKKRFWQRVFGK
ncbi:DNA-binding protein [Hymenobacter monticola]|uniref:DNA-binding protein n=1 Tax=Hymenobacter monticola TaxID=1705399 RepID=A0ABY4BFU4_9BACT|nr:DNA-binding protein [Hymenobacter monticola]UOE36851.1 DNA-binding protein [Hymenobacter monticola]